MVLGPDGAFAGMKPGAIFIDHTTASADVARELHADAARLGLGFIDAPVSGGQAGAQNGALTVMCGGDAAAYARAEPVIAAYAKSCRLMGGPGAGQLTKMVNQICIAGLVQGLAEGLHFAGRAGLDRQLVVDVISKGAAQSWQMDNRHKTMIAGEFDFGFAVDWMRKDLGICLDEARRNGAQSAGRRPGRPVLCRSPDDGRAALGHVQPDRPPGEEIGRGFRRRRSGAPRAPRASG